MRIICEYCGDSYSPNTDSVTCGKKACQKAHQKVYRQLPRVKEYRRELNKEYRKRPGEKEKRRIYGKKYYWKNREKIIKRSREIYRKKFNVPKEKWKVK